MHAVRFLYKISALEGKWSCALQHILSLIMSTPKEPPTLWGDIMIMAKFTHWTLINRLGGINWSCLMAQQHYNIERAHKLWIPHHTQRNHSMSNMSTFQSTCFTCHSYGYGYFTHRMFHWLNKGKGGQGNGPMRQKFRSHWMDWSM